MGKPRWASAPGWRRDAEPLQTASRLPAQRDGLRVTGRGNPLLTGCSVYTYNPTHTYPRNPHLSLRRRISAGVSAEAEGEGKNVLEPPPRSPCFQAPDVGGRGIMDEGELSRAPPEVIPAREPLCFVNGRDKVGPRGTMLSQNRRRRQRSGEPDPRTTRFKRHASPFSCTSKLYANVPQTTTGSGWASENRCLQRNSLVPPPRSLPHSLH